MKIGKFITIGALASAISAPAWASVFFTVDVGSLQDEEGNELVNQGMLYLISAGPDDVFSLPEVGSIIAAGSDDEIVAQWDLSAESSTEGEYIVASGEVAYGGSWTAGEDQLAILWFPDLTQANQSPAASEPYGFYRNTSSGGVGDPWVMPEDGTLLYSLKFFTDGDNPLVNGSDVPSFLAAAGFGAGDAAGTPVAPTTVDSDESANPGTIVFSFDGASAPGGGYRIERRLAGGSDWTVLGFVEDGGTSYSDSDIGRGKDYEYRAVAINGFDEVASLSAEIQSLRARLANISTRGILGSGNQSLILGFTIRGTGDIDILTRVQGPELAQQGVTSFATDPTAELIERVFNVDGTFTDTSIQSNDDWADTELAEIQGLFSRTFAVDNSDVDSTDSAMALELDGWRNFTVVATDIDATDGLALVEVFDATEESPNDAVNRLVNLATRGFVGTGDNILIGGFIVSGQVSSKLLIRGVGPTLANQGVSGALSDPVITLIQSDFNSGSRVDTEIAVNDNWEDAPNVDEIIAVSPGVGATNFASGTKDSAILVDIQPLPNVLYSFKMEGVGGETGIGLIEIFLAD